MSNPMKRRAFLRNALYSSMAAGTGLGFSLPSQLFAATTPVSMPRTLVNLMLYGGMDSRFIFMPAPNHFDQDYVDKIWAARQILYPGAYPDYTTMFDAEYDRVTDQASGFEFGIFNRCGWLRQEFVAGRVAVIANSFCSRNRRHDQSQLNANAGDPAFELLQYDRDGWGGRLVEQLPGTPNTVELSHELSVFCNGSNPGERLVQAIHAKNTRDIALPNVNPDRSPADRRNVLTRALKSYYEARGQELARQTSSPYNIFFQHNAAFREFGDSVTQRLDESGPLPVSLAGLDLNSGHFAQQCRNLYDVCLAPDILNVRTISMRYDGWDTHNSQHGRISDNLEDLFGTSGGLATVLPQINAIPSLDVPLDDQLVFFVSSDFGRQLKANGDRGTDHGRGTYSLLFGKDVNGGVYGEMFPQRESIEENGKVPLETSGADILGKTSTERILTQTCDWMQPGSSSYVFPNAGLSDIETPGLLNDLLAV